MKNCMSTCFGENSLVYDANRHIYFEYILQQVDQIDINNGLDQIRTNSAPF